MGRNLASWKALDEMMLELRKKGIDIPVNVVEDLRAAKSMIRLSCMEGSGDAAMKAEELMANVEAYVVSEGEKTFGPKHVDGWLLRLEEADTSGEVCTELDDEKKFVTGVPRGQKWVRIEPMGDLTSLKVAELAGEFSLQVKTQSDGKLVIHGQLQNLKDFFKKMTALQQNNKTN